LTLEDGKGMVGLVNMGNIKSEDGGGMLVVVKMGNIELEDGGGMPGLVNMDNFTCSPRGVLSMQALQVRCPQPRANRVGKPS
jgi:hypothetical protein